ncbi:MAG: protein kinase [Polyangiaceae bacterium]
MLAKGSTFQGKYCIANVLGEGAHGIVYKATQLSTGQRVAIKLLKLSAEQSRRSEAKRWSRFEQERRLYARLQHPNIVGLIDAGKTSDELLYTVLEYIPGLSLRKLLARHGRLSPSATYNIMAEVLDALCCAHRHRVAHRDLKPDNIIVTSTGARRHAFVLDFGIGHLLSGDTGRATDEFGNAWDFQGSPAYAAPEQLRGLEATPRSDIYSWGLILLECLTGVAAFRGKSTTEVLFDQLGPNPIHIPDDLSGSPFENVLRLALQKDVATRDCKAEALLSELESCVSRFNASEGGSVSGGAPREAASEAAEHVRGEAPTDLLERRQVTVMTCIVAIRECGKHIGQGNADDEALVSTARQICATVQRHGGRLVAAQGEQLIFYFGYPAATENDSMRATRVALELASLVKTERSDAMGDSIELQIGIHTGQVTVYANSFSSGRWNLFGLGETPGVASWLAQHAKPGSVLVTEDTNALLHSAFDVEPIALNLYFRRELVARPLQILGERAVSTLSLDSNHKRPNFVGRDTELGRLTKLWLRADCGIGQCCLISGEAGIGKSRLIRELRNGLRERELKMLAVECSEQEQNQNLFPIADLLRQSFGIDPGEDVATAYSRIESTIAILGLERQSMVPGLAQLCGLPPVECYPQVAVSASHLQERRFRMVWELLFQMAIRHPLLLVLEDLHWADPTTLEFLSFLVRELPSNRILVLLSTRPGSSPLLPLQGIHQLHLGRLSLEQCERLIKESAAGGALSAGQLRQVAERAEGVPLFAEELIRVLHWNSGDSRKWRTAGSGTWEPPIENSAPLAWSFDSETRPCSGTPKRLLSLLLFSVASSLSMP